MAQIARTIQDGVPLDANAPGNSRIDCSFSEALDSVGTATSLYVQAYTM